MPSFSPIALFALLLMVPVLSGCAEEATPTLPGPEAREPETKTFDIPPGRDIEYKLRVVKGGHVNFTWTAEGPLVYDFHGDTGASGYMSHKKGTAVADTGKWEAPFSGNHGWYWKNNGRDTVRVTLTTEGDYTVIGIV